MRVLVTWGSKLGGTEGIARTIGEELQRNGMDVVLEQAAAVRDLRGYDAVIIGGALYANRWQRPAARLVTRNVAALRRIPVWLFSSGPLDDSADRKVIPPAPQVAELMDRIGAIGHATFGGRLARGAKRFPASAMAKTKSGDWRNPDRTCAWAAEVARAIPAARPRPAIDPPARSLWRLAAYGAAGWAACGVVMGGLMATVGTGVAIAVHAVATPLIFVAIAIRYFSARGAREPLLTAIAFTAVVAILDAVVVAGLILHSFDLFASFAGTWLPFALIFVVTWATGSVMAMMPARPNSALSGHA